MRSVMRFVIYGKNTITGEKFVADYCDSLDEVVSRTSHLIRNNPDCIYRWKEVYENDSNQNKI